MNAHRGTHMVLLAMWLDPGRHWTNRDLTLALPSADTRTALLLLERAGHVQQVWMWLRNETEHTIRLWRAYRLTKAGRAAANRISKHRKVVTDQ